MSKNLEWTQEIGNAFLAQQKDVLDAVQRMRKKAYEAGTLQSGPQQTVTVEPSTAAPQEQVIKVESAQPQVVYVPTYPRRPMGPPMRRQVIRRTCTRQRRRTRRATT